MFDDYFLFENNLIDKIHITQSDSILAAVSGGADSMCMLNLLIAFSKNHGNKLGVVHVNHGFREEAVLEAEYVAEFCKTNDIPFFLKEIMPGQCRNSEEDARIYRYKLLNEVADKEGYSYIALAHNAQDRAETVLFNLFRGTGITGLVGIRPVRDRYIRPILYMERNTIEEYLKKENISFCTDKSNLEDDYSRNQIRHHIIPQALEINSGSIKHIGEVSDNLKDIEDFIHEQTIEVMDRTVRYQNEEAQIICSEYIQLNKVLRREIIRMILMDLSPHLKDITSDHIKSIEELSFRDTNAVINLPYGIKAYREYDSILISNKEKEETYWQKEPYRISIPTKENPSVIVEIDNLRKISFNYMELKDSEDNFESILPRNKYTKWFDYDKINAFMMLRKRQTGDVIVIDKEGHKKDLNRVFIDKKIPERYRDQIPIIAMEDDILWAVGERDSYAYRIDKFTKTVLEITLLEE